VTVVGQPTQPIFSFPWPPLPWIIAFSPWLPPSEKEKAMQTEWVKPDFEEISVNGECTAYAGVDAE
jgi:hypothetical protein